MTARRATAGFAAVVAAFLLLTDLAAAGAVSPRYLALGDSYTIGQGVSPADRWPAQLAALLSRHGIPFAPPEIVARTGWTTEDLAAALDREPPRGPFALVSLQIGVNDQFQGNEADAGYRDRFRRLLGRAIGWAGGEPRRVLVLSIPDWGVAPFAEGRDGRSIAAAIDRFNAVNREETLRARARWVDITPESRRAGSDRSLFAADGLHPSGRQYAAWAHLALDPATAALSTHATPVRR
ncbi:MAG TPA: GDSL-type esterase/lipase family protein [Thermoanaerobaculia bacterium]|jgi:lysophospholipase L1-like esterase|nr:GDSL-type esterase/lipase family protein [Thermoanaerobaculia bacterium]